jgi:hypothetical protein
MKNALIVLSAILVLSAVQSFAQENNYGYPTYGQQPEQRKNNPNYQQDNYGNYTKQENLYKDTDRDGVPNHYDYNDRNPNIQQRGQKDYSKPYKGIR